MRSTPAVTCFPRTALLLGWIVLSGCVSGNEGGAEVRGNTVGVSSCGAPPTAPTGFGAAIADRRNTSVRLSWTAPITFWGGAVAGYQIRYAKVPITDTNFDDAAVTSTFAYSGTPPAPGSSDEVTVTGLNIETDYYFAAKAVDALGTASDLVATSTATKATFNVTVLSGVGTDNAGFDLDGSADLGTAADGSFTNDGLSDLIVGATGGTHVYVYFGTSSGYSTTPSITITGSVSGFGKGVVNAGDLDGDGLADIAIASPSDSGGKVYIFSRKSPPGSWGSTTNWPSTLTDTQANYVISSTAPLTAGMTNRPLSRVGDFDGDGVDDLAVSYALWSTNMGAVLIVKGGASFGSVTLPDAGKAIELDGAVAKGGFGVTTLGIGKFYTAAAGNTLLATASIAGASYAFAGRSPAGVIAATAADDVTVGVAADRYGTPNAYLGPLGSSPGAFTLGANAGKYVDLHLGTAASGPFLGTNGGAPAASIRFVDVASANSFGVVSIGSGVKGTSTFGSFIGGDALPDLVLAGQGETGRPIYLVSGAVLTTLSGTVDVSQTQAGNVPGILKVSDKFPANWSNGFTTGCSIVDLNGDGHADFAIGEFSSAAPGRVAVFY